MESKIWNIIVLIVFANLLVFHQSEAGHKEKEQTLGGFFLYRVYKGKIQYLLQQQSKDNEWSLPKGRSDPDEEVTETAIREMKEETGWELGVDYYANFVREVYFEHETDTGLLEKIHMWPAKLLKARPIQLSEEHSDYAWLEYDAAVAIVQKPYWSALKRGDEMCRNYESKFAIPFITPLLNALRP